MELVDLKILNFLENLNFLVNQFFDIFRHNQPFLKHSRLFCHVKKYINTYKYDIF